METGEKPVFAMNMSMLAFSLVIILKVASMMCVTMFLDSYFFRECVLNYWFIFLGITSKFSATELKKSTLLSVVLIFGIYPPPAS